MIPLDWTKLDSSNISKVKFIPNRHDLRGDVLIEFNTGKVYRYRDVPAHKCENMVHASSAYKSFKDNIHPYHEGEKYT
jgi:hypothetical protein